MPNEIATTGPVLDDAPASEPGNRSRMHLRDQFFFFLAVLLSTAALAKLLAAARAGATLNYRDAILQLPQRHILFIAGTLELLAAAVLAAARSERIKMLVTGWLATNFLAYRLALWWMGAANICNCFGDWDANFLFSSRTRSQLALAIIALMLVGSYGFFIADWWRRRKERLPALQPQ